MLVGRKKKTKVMPSGFTLIEVLASLVIIGFIVSISVPIFRSHMNYANDQAEEINLQLLQGAVKQYKLDTGIFPADLSYLLANPGTGIPGWSGPYLDALPTSPTGHSYDIDQATGTVIVR